MIWTRPIRPLSIFLAAISLISVAAAATILPGCRPSPYLTRKYAFYNFAREGFLSADIVQTIGQARIRPRGQGGMREARRRCLEDALGHASQRMLSIMMHTYFDIKAGAPRAGMDENFASDYPRSFTGRDYIRAGIAFKPLLRKGFIALQDARSRENCTIVFRIIGSDMPAEIRSLKLKFKPEKLE